MKQKLMSVAFTITDEMSAYNESISVGDEVSAANIQNTIKAMQTVLSILDISVIPVHDDNGRYLSVCVLKGNIAFEQKL